MRRGGLKILSFWQYPSDKKSDQVMHLNSLKPLKSAKMRKPPKVKGFPINYPPPPPPPQKPHVLYQHLAEGGGTGQERHFGRV